MLLFGGCSMYNKSYKPDMILDKKVLSSRKDQIIIDGRVKIIAIATYLNNVDSSIEDDDREYFFIEIFSELDIPLIDYIHFSINDNAKFLWIREMQQQDSIDKTTNLNNKWSKGFLIAFESISYQSKKNLELKMEVDTFGEMAFNFAYEVFEMQF